MSLIYEKLVENSLHAALASIEIYNKPDFKYREQIFTILNINAWELLLKAQILKAHSDDLTSLYITLPDGSAKINRSGNSMTIEIIGAINKLSLNPVVAENLEKLIEIRDTAVHFFHDESLSYLVYALGVASLRNYQKLLNDWFEKSLLEYNFYILPLGFAYNFKTLSMLEFETKPAAISKLIASVSNAQSLVEPSDGFYFICEVTTKIISAKKFIEEPDFITMVDANANSDALIIERLQRLIDRYPLSYKQVGEKIKLVKPDVKLGQINRVIREHKIKDNPKLSGYNFRTKTHFEQYEQTKILHPGTVSIYNEDAVRYITEHLDG